MINLSDCKIKEIFNELAVYANFNTTCTKVAVGSGIVSALGSLLFKDCNRSEDYNCLELNTCFKYKESGIYESTEETRHLCKASHSEVNTLNKLVEFIGGKSNKDSNYFQKRQLLRNCILFVTRYPCLNCAKEIVKYKKYIKEVRYCGKQEISGEVKYIFESNSIRYYHYPEIDYENGIND